MLSATETEASTWIPGSWQTDSAVGARLTTIPSLSDIQIRDPFVLVLPEDRRYWLFGTTDPNAWSGPGLGFDCWSSSDLIAWDGPFPAFRPAPGFPGTTNF